MRLALAQLNAVVGDIDRLYIKLRAGSGQQQNAAYDGAGVGAGSSGSANWAVQRRFCG